MNSEPNGITEKSSEKEPRKRGRPMINGSDDFLAVGFPHLTSRRGRIEALLAESAFGAFASVTEQKPIPTWILFYIDGATGTIRHRSILAALARIEDEGELIRLAQYVAERRMPTKRAVAFIRAHRLGRQPKASEVDLADRIIKVVNTYFADYPATSWPLVQEALEIATEAVADSRTESEAGRRRMLEEEKSV